MIRDGTIYDGVNTGITSERFYKLRNERGGKICTDNITKLLCRRRKDNLIDKVKLFFEKLYAK